MLFPLRTDAPTYHRPWATAGVIAVNVGAYVWTLKADEREVLPFVLRYGQWAPWQWLTSVFLHANWVHLVGNMIFLWVFGFIVEGKVGWKLFLALYGAIAVTSNAFEQTVMLGGAGGALGASGVIYGLMAIAMVWAPDNKVECVVALPPYRRVRLSVMAFGAIYLGLQMFFAALGGFRMGTALLHLIGAAAGLPLGVLMLRRGWVDCEGWDWFSRHGHRVPPISTTDRHSRRSAPQPSATRAAVETAAVRFANLLRACDVEAALRLHAAIPADERSTLALADRELLVLELSRANRLAEARPVIAGVLHDDPGNSGSGLLEARLLLREGRPSRAAQVLAAISGRLEEEPQRREHAQLISEVAARLASGPSEREE